MPENTIIVPHQRYGSVVWHVLCRSDAEKTMTLLGSPLPEKRAFYNPAAHGEARYLRTDFSTDRGQDAAGTLCEIQLPPSSDEADKTNVQRYSDIVEYGSNQWAVSDIRHELNSSFLRGFPEAFQQRILPQTRDLILTKTPCSQDEQKKTPPQPCSSGDLVYDEYSSASRFTHCITRDHIFLPTAADMPSIRTFAGASQLFLPRCSYWLMDARYQASVPYAVTMFQVTISPNGMYQYNIGWNNARYPLHVCPMCVVTAE